MTIQKPWIARAILQALTAIAVLGVVAKSAPLLAEAEHAPPTVMVILDGSGSMWGKLGQSQQTKLGLSQSLLIDALQAPNPKLNLGFASFGHRRAGNCSDAQVIVPPGPANAEAVIQKITKLNPRGKGPLSLALRNTVASIEPSVASSIVLVHDGYDNCRQDPCQVAEEIATSHPNLAIQLISLDLPENTADTMSCLAKRTNGKAYLVRNEAEFKTAVQSAMTLTMLRPPKAAERLTDKPPPKADVQQSEADIGPSRIRLVAGFKTDAGQRIRDVTWRIVSPADAQKTIIEKRTTEFAEPLPAGRYIVHAQAGLAKAEQQITVAEKGETRVRVMLEAGVITFTSPPQHNVGSDMADPMFLTLGRNTKDTSPDNAQPIWIGAEKKSDQLIVPTGTYKLDIERGSISKTVEVTVTSGKATAVDTALDGGLLILDAAIAVAQSTEIPSTNSLAPRLAKNVAYVISTDDPSAPGGRREVGRSASPNAKFQLPPGTFYAEAQLGQAKRERRFAIGGGQIVRHQFRFDVAHVRLEAQLGTHPVPDSTPVTFKAYALTAGPRTPVLSTSKRRPNLVLPTGRYRFEAEVHGKVRGKSGDVDVRSGADQTFTIPLNAGQVDLKTGAPAGRSLAALTRYQIRNASGAIVWRGRVNRQISTLLTPGTYVLEKRSEPKQKQNFEVRVGEVTVVGLDGAR